jgi:integrase
MGALFTTTTGGLLRRGDWNPNVLKPALARAGLPSSVTFHDLRHSFASTLLGAGVPLLDVSRWLGHASITETADTYGHLMPEAEDRARAALTAALSMWRHVAVMATDTSSSVCARESR